MIGFFTIILIIWCLYKPRERWLFTLLMGLGLLSLDFDWNVFAFIFFVLAVLIFFAIVGIHIKRIREESEEHLRQRQRDKLHDELQKQIDEILEKIMRQHQVHRSAKQQRPILPKPAQDLIRKIQSIDQLIKNPGTPQEKQAAIEAKARLEKKLEQYIK